MCGRSRCTLNAEQVACTESRWVAPSDGKENYTGSYNLTPGHVGLVMRRHDSSESALVVQPMRWGLVPAYTKPDAKPDYFRMFNARSETVLEKPVFSRLLRASRCIVLLNGFYEWKKEGSKKKPYYVSLAGAEGKGNDIMYMAGLFDCWTDADGCLRQTYTILTTDSSKRLQWLHDRMPVLLPTQEARDAWLAPELEASTVKEVRLPYDGADLVWHEVDPGMGNPKIQGPRCCRPVCRPSATSFFQPRRRTAKATSSIRAAADTKVGAADVEAGVAVKSEPIGTIAAPEGSVLNTDDKAAVESKPDVKAPADLGADGNSVAVQAALRSQQTPEGVASTSAAVTFKEFFEVSLLAKRAATGDIKPMPESKKAKASPHKTGARPRGQRTMAAFFPKKG